MKSNEYIWRRRRRGVTLIEVLIVVAIITLVSAGVAVAVLPYWEKTRAKTAWTNARDLRGVVKTWWLLHEGTECPTYDQLVQDEAIDRDSQRKDPWGTPWRIQCSGHDVTVISDGADKLADTADDIRVPPT